MPRPPMLDRPRQLALIVAGALVAAGATLFILSTEPDTPVPVVPGSAASPSPSLAYVRSLPDAGDEDFLRPVGVAVGNGKLFVSDSEASLVRVFSTSGIDAGVIGEGMLAVPSYVACDEESSTILVTDRELGSVLRFAEDGTPLGELRPSSEPTAAWAPLGVAVDGEGLVAVTDSSGRHRMLVMDREGDVRFSLGSAEASGTPGNVGVALDFPNSVAFREDEIWVSDSNNRRLLVFDSEGRFKQFVRLDGVARGLAFLVEGQAEETFAAVVDALGSTIVLLDGDGAEVARYGEPGTSAGRLAYPNDVAYDPRTAQLFVADTGNARVQVWKVTWPDEKPNGAAAIIERLPFSPKQLFGAVLAVLGLVVALLALWPRRRPAQKLL